MPQKIEILVVFFFPQDIAINKMQKWLQKDIFIRLTIEAAGKKKEAEALQVRNYIQKKIL